MPKSKDRLEKDYLIGLNIYLPGRIGKYHDTNHVVAFMFDDRQAGERFNAAFRRLIKLCQPRSQKPRWNR